MHAATLNQTTIPGVLFRIMKKRPGHLWGAWELAQVASTTCLSTHISALRFRARAEGWEVPDAIQKGRRYYYMIRRVKRAA